MMYRRKGYSFAVGLLLLVFVGWTAAAVERPACPQPLPRTSLTISDRVLDVEVAASLPARSCGLAWRHELARGHGMLFVYQRTTLLRFWMRDTFIPLDIAFIDEDWRIVNIETMSPATPLRIHSAQAPARYALETRAGWFARNGITAGDRVEVTLPANLAVD